MADLTDAPALAPLLARGALLSPFKRPRPDAGFPRHPLVLPGVRIDLARLAAYERVCGFATGEDALPVTYPHVLGFPLAMRLMSGWGFPLPLLGLVHTSIEITQRRSLAATGEYEVTVQIEGLAPHRRGTEAAVVTGVRAAGDVVWESRSTYLARHRTDGRTGQARQADGHTAKTPQADGHTAQAPQADGHTTQTPQADDRTTQTPQADGHTTQTPQADDRTTQTPQADGHTTQTPQADDRTTRTPQEEAGPLPVVAEWRLAGDIGRRYAAASGDRNPIHLYPLTARPFGFRRAVAHGMWTLARCLAAHGVPERALVRAQFRAPVQLPGTVTYAAQGERFELRGGDRTQVSGAVYPA
ncbi:MaoC family dehydratase [Streptomyces blattellae]|uniref:MaoC family dehydratase n=1 Tax=Streptomyces blattellae TaxID=2569855 RepID=UPI001E5F747D|nr:MaoC/PaaZ C-terminal domain-containing protein [Streptomyces blattellae]